ncbi:MAG: caspase family protein, partial [Planctomycetes bacterium]|nr:caspase family protein [Planctomycetota bacterium]
MRDSLLLLFVAVALAGCGGETEFVTIDDDPDVQRRMADWEPIGATVGVVPIRFHDDFDPERINAKTEETNRFSVSIDREVMRKEFLEFFRHNKVFASTTELGRWDDQFTLNEWLDKAWDENLDAVCEVTVRRYEVGWVGRNGWYWPNLLVWGYTWVGSWFVADERYFADAEFHVTLHSAHSKFQIFRGEYRNQAETNLDDFQRGWDLFGIFLIPGSMRPDNWGKVNSVVMPLAMHDVKVKMFKDYAGTLKPFLDRRVPNPGGPDANVVTGKRMALVIGAPDVYGDYRITGVKYAGNDASALHYHLTEALAADFPTKNVRLLTDKNANRRNILDGLRWLQEKIRPPDDVIIFFAGGGLTAEGAGGAPANFILPYDT